MDVVLPRPLGRDTAATLAAWPTVRALVSAAPHTFAGTAPEESPKIYRFCPGGFDNQWIGMCVGKGSKNAAATILRIPPGANEGSAPLPTVQLSGLYCYINARLKGIALGAAVHNRPNDPQGGGAVVAYSMLAMQEHGVISNEDYPDTQTNQMACADRDLPSALYAKGQSHRLVHCARLEAMAQWQDFQGAGYPIVFGIAIPGGWMNTAEDGQIGRGGGIIGGHCMCAVGYSRTLNRQYIRNSWVHWGTKTDDPEYQGQCGGWNNVGWVPLDWFEQTYLRAGGFDGSGIDAFVINDVPGFSAPKIVARKAAEMFT